MKRYDPQPRRIKLWVRVTNWLSVLISLLDSFIYLISFTYITSSFTEKFDDMIIFIEDKYIYEPYSGEVE